MLLVISFYDRRKGVLGIGPPSRLPSKKQDAYPAINKIFEKWYLNVFDL